jgi:hypothetical protein
LFLFEQYESLASETEDGSYPISILVSMVFPVPIIFAYIEGIKWGKAFPTLAGKESMLNAFQFCHLRDFKIGESVLRY